MENRKRKETEVDSPIDLGANSEDDVQIVEESPNATPTPKTLKNAFAIMKSNQDRINKKQKPSGNNIFQRSSHE
jgi:hypothetical protein